MAPPANVQQAPPPPVAIPAQPNLPPPVHPYIENIIKSSLGKPVILSDDNIRDWLNSLFAHFSVRNWESLLSSADAYPILQGVGKAILSSTVTGSDADIVRSSATVFEAIEALKLNRDGQKLWQEAKLTTELWSGIKVSPNGVRATFQEIRKVQSRLADLGKEPPESMLAMAAIQAFKTHPKYAQLCMHLLAQHQGELKLETVRAWLTPADEVMSVGASTSTGNVPGAMLTVGTEMVSAAQANAMVAKALGDFKSKLYNPKTKESQRFNQGRGDYHNKGKAPYFPSNNSGRGRGGGYDRGRGGKGDRGGKGGRGGRHGNPKKHIICNNCGKPDHFSYQCRRPCTKCNKWGHSSHRCAPATANTAADPYSAPEQGVVLHTQAYRFPPGFNPLDRIEAQTVIDLTPPSTICMDLASDEVTDSEIAYGNVANGECYLSADDFHPKYKFILDGGASHHMTPVKEYLHDYKEMLLPKSVKVAIDVFIDRVGVGTMKFMSVHNMDVKLELREVWYVPELGSSLMSGNKLKAAGCKIMSGDLPDMSDYVYYKGKQIMRCAFSDGLCRPDIVIVTNPESLHTTEMLAPTLPDLGPAQTFITYAQSNHSTDKQSPALWHQRLGHT